VPAEHQHRDEHGRGVEDFLAHARRQAADGVGEGGHQAGAGNAGEQPTGDPQPPARHTLGGGEDDGNHQRGFENLAEDDERRRQHGPSPCPYWTINWVLDCCSWYSSWNS
jgi:hypothetical protein